MKTHEWTLWAMVLLAPACSSAPGGSASNDAGSLADRGSTRDAGAAPDAGSAKDAGVAKEAGPAKDAAVPGLYADLYTQLAGDLSDFQGAIAAVWNGSPSPVTYAGQLTAANCNNGPGVLTSAQMKNIDAELDFLKTLGVKAVSVEVSFPMLYAPFLGSAQSQWVTFYQNVASAVRSRGFTLIVESQSMIPTGLDSQWGTQLQSFYPTLSFQQYIAARATTATTVASTMKPDYFVLQEEPDTEAHQASQNEAETIKGSTMMLDSTFAAVRAQSPAIKLGAGFGSWLQASESFAKSFTQTDCGASQPCVSTRLDFLDMHLFPIIEHAVDCAPGKACQPGSMNFWQNAMTVVGVAKTAGVHMTVSQAWLRKVRDCEWLTLSGGGGIEEAREAYSFWEPLDKDFLKALHDVANYEGMYWVAPFNTQNFSAYLTWDASKTAISKDCSVACGPTSSCGILSPATVFRTVQQDALKALTAGMYTSTGQYWHDLIQ